MTPSLSELLTLPPPDGWRRILVPSGWGFAPIVDVAAYGERHEDLPLTVLVARLSTDPTGSPARTLSDLMDRRVRRGEPAWRSDHIAGVPVVACAWAEDGVERFTWFVPFSSGVIVEFQAVRLRPSTCGSPLQEAARPILDAVVWR